MPGASHEPNDKVEVPYIMRALEPEVVDAIWAAVEPLLPPPDQSHPLGCHRPRISNRLCLRGLFIRLVTGSSWVDIEAILDHQVSDTTLRARRDAWIDAGVFDKLKDEGHCCIEPRQPTPRIRRAESRGLRSTVGHQGRCS